MRIDGEELESLVTFHYQLNKICPMMTRNHKDRNIMTEMPFGR